MQSQSEIPKRSPEDRQVLQEKQGINGIRLSLPIEALFIDLMPRIQSQFLATTERISSLLSFEDVTVTLFHLDWPETDLPIFGYAANKNNAVILLDAFHPRRNDALDFFPRALSHELGHTKRFEGPGFGSTVYDALITEGLAQHLEQEVVDNIDPNDFLWGLTPPQIEQLTERAREEFNHPLLEYRDTNHERWFVSGSPEDEIPPRAGYAIGYALVGQYLRLHPDKKASDLMLEPSETFRPKE